MPIVAEEALNQRVQFMPSRNNPLIQAKIYEARKKKSAQIHAAYLRGVKEGVRAARAIIESEEPQGVYDFQSRVLHRLKLIPSEGRMLSGADIEKSHEKVIEEAKALLPTTAPSDDQFAMAAVSVARTENEAWILHHDLTGIRQDDLPAERRGKVADCIRHRFPA